VKEPLLLIHGFTDTAATWRPIIPLLEPYHELIVPNVLGHRGGSPLPADMTNPLDAMADDLERILDDAGYDKVHVVGNSMGGWLAFELAHRGRAHDVIALSPAFGWETAEAPAHTVRQFRMAHRATPLVKKMARKWAVRPKLRKLVLRDVVAHGDRIPPRTAYELMMGSTECAIFPAIESLHDGGDFRTELEWAEDLAVPTRIAWGTRDRTIPFKTCSGWYKSRFPDADWVELADCGHLPQHDNPELVARTILDVTARAKQSQLG
jgi:pimeloyl-ACP methyl ester carboxylesterase